MLKKILIFLTILLILAAAFYFFSNSKQQPQAGSPIQIEFIMAHKPDNEDNVALIQEFADAISSRTNGEVEILPVHPGDGFANGAPADSHRIALEAISSGNPAMAQVSVKRFDELFADLYPLDALNAPGVFESHDHAAKVLDGDIGQDLLEVVSAGTNGKLRGLAFTYSGGFRNFISTVPLEKLADLDGLRVRALSTLASELANQLGIETLADIRYRSVEWEEGMLDGSIELEEAENIRVTLFQRKNPKVVEQLKTILETQHSMFLTLLVTNSDTFSMLTAEQQAIFEEEAYSLALKERALSIQQAIDLKTDLQAKGVSFVSLSPEDRETLDEAMRSVRETHATDLKPWFERIEAVK